MPSNPAQSIAGKPCSYRFMIVLAEQGLPAKVPGRPIKCTPRTNCHATVR